MCKERKIRKHHDLFLLAILLILLKIFTFFLLKIIYLFWDVLKDATAEGDGPGSYTPSSVACFTHAAYVLKLGRSIWAKPITLRIDSVSWKTYYGLSSVRFILVSFYPSGTCFLPVVYVSGQAFFYVSWVSSVSIYSLIFAGFLFYLFLFYFLLHFIFKLFMKTFRYWKLFTFFFCFFFIFLKILTNYDFF
jgi:hypothetical protein